MKSSKRPPILLLGIGAVAALACVLIAAGAALIVAIPSVDQQLPAGSAPLVTHITNPPTGSAAVFGAPTRISVSATGANPLAEIHLWVDGTRVASQTPPADSLDAAMSFDWSPNVMGTSTIVARAIDSKGYAADSAPLRLNIAAADVQTAQKITYPEEGSTLQDIAAEVQLPIDELVGLNPDLPADGPLPPDTPVVVAEIPVDDTVVSPPPDQPEPPAPSQETPPPAQSSPAQGWVPISKITFWLGGLGGAVPILPAAPSLSAQSSGCEVTLTIGDASENESGFFVYALNAGAFDFERVATLAAHSGDGAITTTVPASFGVSQYKVAAFNAGGESPSAPVSLTNADQACAAPDQQMITLRNPKLILSLTMERVYCYVSPNNSDWLRLPLDPDEFYTPDINNVVDLSADLGPLGKSGEPLTLYTECWGWQGGVLTPLGSAQGLLPDTGGVFQAANENYAISGEVENSFPYSGFIFVVNPPFIPFDFSKIVPAPFNVQALFTDSGGAVVYWQWMAQGCFPAAAGEPEPPCPYDSNIQGFHIYNSKGEQVATAPSFKQAGGIPVEGFGGADQGECYTVTAFTASAESQPSAPACLDYTINPRVSSVEDYGLGAPYNLQFVNDPSTCLDHVKGLGKLLVGALCQESSKEGKHVITWDWSPVAACPSLELGCTVAQEPDGFLIYELKDGLTLVDVLETPDQTVEFLPPWATGGNRCFLVRAYRGLYVSNTSNTVCGTQPPPSTVTLEPSYLMRQERISWHFFGSTFCDEKQWQFWETEKVYPPDADALIVSDNHLNTEVDCDNKFDLSTMSGIAFDIQAWQGQPIQSAIFTMDQLKSYSAEATITDYYVYKDIDPDIDIDAPSCLRGLYESHLSLGGIWHGDSLISAGPFGSTALVDDTSTFFRDEYDVTQLLNERLADGGKTLRFLFMPEMATEVSGGEYTGICATMYNRFRLIITTAAP